jgi:hypothetical protein
MHQTTVRFGPDLWEALEAESSALGMSAAQFVREATLARLTYMAARRGDHAYDDALVAAGATVGPPAVEGPVGHARDAGDEAREQQLASRAVGAQSEQVWRRAQEVRAQARALREDRKGLTWHTE